MSVGSKADPLIVLVPSPLLGPYSWSLVARELAHRRWDTVISIDVPDPIGGKPCWWETVGGVRASLRDVPDERWISLIAHSGAGPLLPAIANAVPQSVAGYLFVDAGLPAPGASRLDVIAAENVAFASELRAALDSGRLFPTWSDEDLRPLIPDVDRRHALLGELRPRGPDFWTEELPSISIWPDAPCGYLQFSDAYQSAVDAARRAGWPTRHLPAGHFHQVVDPSAVADALIELLALPRATAGLQSPT